MTLRGDTFPLTQSIDGAPLVDVDMDYASHGAWKLGPAEPDYASRECPGIDDPRPEDNKPYPVNVYNRRNFSESGIAGTLHNGVFTPLPIALVPQPGVFWCDMYTDPATGKLACGFLESTVIWNGVSQGGTEFIPGDEALDIEPLFMRTEDGSLQGEWPIHVPKRDRQVNPVKARLAAELDQIESDYMASFENQEAA